MVPPVGILSQFVMPVNQPEPEPEVRVVPGQGSTLSRLPSPSAVVVPLGYPQIFCGCPPVAARSLPGRSPFGPRVS